MLAFVAQHYAHVLLDEHVRLIDEFGQLSRDAQCLYVRLVNRKGRLFARNKLRYPELGDIDGLVAELRERRWVEAPSPAHYDDLLRFLTRSEIYNVLLARFTGMSRSLKKQELVAFAREHIGASDFLSALNSNRLLVQARTESVRYLLFLYFGRVQDGLSQFTMRDLGLVRTQSFTDSYEPRFADRREAQEHFFYARRLHEFKSTAGANPINLVEDIATWPEPEFAGSAAIRDKLAYRIGRQLEKQDDVELALRCYQAGESARCSERVVRLLLKSDRRDAAREFLERCLDQPRSDEEWLVASDIYARKFEKKRTSELTDLLRASDVIDIDESRIGSPEAAAVEHFEQHGLPAHRTENTLWRTFFGLLFWNELFVADDAALHSPFEFLPSTLADKSFLARHRESIEAKLASLDDPAALKRQLLKISTAHYGTPNGVFRWRRSMIDALFVLIDHAPAGALQSILRNFCEDYKHSRYGYPDLLVVDEQGPRFIEIKAEGDHLRRNQLLRIQQLRKAGLRADVMRVRWILDPRQDYVVVDVETTGGRGDQHRVTEIGAVKVRNGEIVDSFQSLINPQRAIPPGITRLTGISAEMVADAPYFADVADELETFLDGSIFVAHNVDFDYGFINNEFARIGRRFRFPKLCTCASMRRLYPGHRSYSLAALCRAYDIPLKSHHRALCDAEAAAHLLLMINEKRSEALTDDPTRQN